MNIKNKIEDLSDKQLSILANRLGILSDSASNINTKKLVAYVVADELLPPTKDELLDLIGQSLPSYMVPQDVFFVESIPLSPNGKVDLSVLEKTSSNDESISSKDFVKAESNVEKVIASIWADALGTELISVNDNFFEVGGDSMLSASMIANMREAFEVDIPLRYLFEAPTISSMCKVILNDESIKKSVEQNAELIVQLEEMTDDEVEQLLAAESDGIEGLNS